MRKKKELTEAEKRDLAMKYEVARGTGASGEGGAVRLEGADIERKRTHRRHYGDKKNGGAKADRSGQSGQSGQSGHLKGQAVDRGADRGMDSRKTFPVYKDSCLHLKTDRAII